MVKNYNIFISYRRDDCPEVAVRLYELLSHRLPSADVFLDVKNAKPGDWKRDVKPRLEHSTVVLALFGDQWELAGKKKRSTMSMLDEIRLALRKKKSIIPVFWERARPKYPASIRRLEDEQEFRLTKTIDDDVGKLIALMDHLGRHTRPVAFISSTLAYNDKDRTLDGLDYFTNIVTKVTQQLHDQNIDIVLKVPPYSFRTGGAQVVEEQMSLVKDVLARPDEYRGAIIAPFERDPLVDVLAKSSKQSIHRFPIATIDKALLPKHNNRLRGKLLQPPITVENDGFFNGGLAGACAIDCIKLLEAKVGKVPSLHALVLMGLEGSAQRADGFTAALKSKFGRNIRVSRTSPNEFTQKAGQQFMEGAIARGEVCHVIFACNDELALGARKALNEAEIAGKWQSPVGRPYPFIIGFDGISDVSRPVDSGDRWLLNTVNVNLPDQIAELLKAFVPRLRGDWSRPHLKPVQGYRHHPTQLQDEHMTQVLSGQRRAAAPRRRQ